MSISRQEYFRHYIGRKCVVLDRKVERNKIQTRPEPDSLDHYPKGHGIIKEVRNDVVIIENPLMKGATSRVKHDEILLISKKLKEATGEDVKKIINTCLVKGKYLKSEDFDAFKVKRFNQHGDCLLVTMEEKNTDTIRYDVIIKDNLTVFVGEHRALSTSMVQNPAEVAACMINLGFGFIEKYNY